MKPLDTNVIVYATGVLLGNLKRFDPLLLHRDRERYLIHLDFFSAQCYNVLGRESGSVPLGRDPIGRKTLPDKLGNAPRCGDAGAD